MSTSIVSQLKDSAGTTYDIAGRRVKIYNSNSGTAAVTSSPYTYSKWELTDNTITSYEDGLTILYKIPVPGNGTYGTCLQINSLGYHPVVYGSGTTNNGHIGTRYSTNTYILLTYVAAISRSVYSNSASAATITGCWLVINDYDANTFDRTVVPGPVYANSYIGQYTIIGKVGNGWNSLANYSSSTSSSKTMNTSKNFTYSNPLNLLLNLSGAKTSAGTATSWGTYLCGPVDVRYIANATTTNCISYVNSTATTGDAFELGKPVYLEISISNDLRYWNPTQRGLVVSSFTSGKYYVELGVFVSSSAYTLSVSAQHPVYYYDGTALCPAEKGYPSVYAYSGSTQLTDSDGTGVVIF